MGNLISTTDTIKGLLQGNTSYIYDVLDRTIDITQSGVGVSNKGVNYSYSAVGEVTGMSRYNGSELGVVSNYSYVGAQSAASRRIAMGNQLSIVDCT